jgi:uncharacterized membrane protein
MKAIENGLILMLVLFAAMATLWIVGHVDRWVQTARGVQEAKVDRDGGIIVKVGLALVLITLIGLYMWAGGGATSAVEECFGSMRC